VTDTVVVALIAAVPATVAALVSRRNGYKIEEIHLAVNSRLSQLLKVVEAKSHAEGVKQEADRREGNGPK